MNTSTKKNKIARVATLLLLVLLFAANTLAQTPWQGDGTEQNPYRINNTGDLETLAQQVNSGTSYESQFFRLDADLAYDYDTTTQNNHTAIGIYDYYHGLNHPFSGTFDGDGHTISGIRISNNNNYQGLFGYCINSVVKNIILTDAQISGKDYVGGIVGSSDNSSIEDCQVANNVTVSGFFNVGGIMGINCGCSFENCHVANNVNVSGNNDVGGIAGCSTSGSSFEDCQVANNVDVSGNNYVGGIVGSSSGGSSVNCHVANNVTVSGSSWYVGGIMGHADNYSIEDCQVANNVTVNSNIEYVGTIVGYYYNSTFYRNYYHGCTVNDVPNATNVGAQGHDITENNGAVPGYLLILGEHITSDAISFTIPTYGEMPETTYHMAPSNDTITLGYELAGCEVTYYVNGEAIADSTFIMPAEDVNVTAMCMVYVIHTTTDWNYFCDALQDNNTWNRFIDRTVKLAADITVTRMAGSSTHDFMGTFDGDGHTLTIAYGTAIRPLTEEYAAPFRYVENGANIHNLHVHGIIYTSKKFASGIVGSQRGTVSVSNCRSSVVILSSKIGDGTHGGIVANQHGTLTVSGCVFDGRLLTTNGTTLCSGLVGYHNDGTCTISDCLYTPAEVTLPSGLTYITDGATFCRNYSGTPANSYYTETLGEAQGKLAHSITSEDVTPVFAGEATEYDVSGITTCGTGLQYGSMLYAGNEDQVSLNLVAHNGFSAVAATYTPEGGTATELTPVNGVYTFTMPDADVVIDAVTEYIIHDATEWNNFCDALQDNDTYNRFIGKTVKLAADISVTRMAGSSYHDFMGTFDGQGHTLTIAYGTAESPITEEYAAPFRNLENGAVIRNLHVDGHIYTSDKYASGLAGCQYGTVSISNCRSSVVIHSSKSGDGTHGGIVAVHHNTLTVSGCVFDGRLLTTNGTTLCGGLIGYHYGTITLSDCLYAPATDVTLADGETYITSGATLCRNYSGTFDNCYYTETLGTAQGKLAHSITPGDGVLMEMASETTEYDISGITSYGTGIMYDSVLYAGNGDVVGLNLLAPESFYAVTYTPEGGTATGLTLANGVYSFTMPDADVVIDAVTEYIIHNATEWNNFCDALQDNDTYNHFIGKTVKLAADISVTRMAGSSYHDFMGTFDGQGHTLTIAYGTAESPITEEYAAPFRNLENGAYIHSLHVDGHIYTSNKFASGLAGCQWGTVSVSDCRSSVVIHSSKSGDGTHGGIVAVHHGTLTVSGCVYDGRMLTTNGTTLCAGLIGYHYGTITISDCLYAPATDVTPADGETNITSGATFCRNYSGTFDNCYYTETLGTAQGKLVLTNPAVLPIGDPNATYDVSSLTLYGNGIQFGEVFYYDTERNFLRTIAGYGTDDNGWNLIASPVANDITPTETNGFLTDEYDLYRFNQAADLEWENWKDTVYDNYHFDLASGRGYLYASQTETMLVFTGTPYSGTGEVTLTKTDGVNLSGWNLVGNPFSETVYLADGRPFYTMNDDGSEIVGATSTSIGAMEAIFVVAEQDGETLTFTTEAPSKGRSLNLNLSRANRSGPSTGSGAAVIDRAIIRFGEGRQLPKFQLRGNSTKLYIPQDNGDYAVVNVGRDVARYVSTIPVNFKAKEDGQYTLSLGSENVEFDYLHLIDNMTGADVDLLAPEPVEGPASYTFTAKTTDYETRFKLVFSANNEDGPSTCSGTFAFISNGNIIVNGEGVLQIVDVTGRIVRCTDVARNVSTAGMTPGVYVLRLINGKDVKTQKIVID